MVQRLHEGNREKKYLTLHNITKTFIEGNQKRAVLRGVTVDFYKGEFSAILGKSGSGKTTLLNLISGIDLLDQGDIFLDGISLNQMREHARTLFRRKNVGFIFQFFNLLPTLTVWENLILPLELNQMTSPPDIDRANELLIEVGLFDRKDSYPDRLSGGEQQRVAIARAVVHDPKLILADEPTGNLDEDTGKIVMQLLHRIVKKTDKNLILVTHSNEIASYSDRVYRLKDGALLRVEKP